MAPRQQIGNGLPEARLLPGSYNPLDVRTAPFWIFNFYLNAMEQEAYQIRWNPLLAGASCSFSRESMFHPIASHSPLREYD
jgi:hypothetical protein